jgi:GDP-mannose 6-dehydrogenase
MRAISVFGLGYVGSVTAACFSGKGHKVLGIDVAEEKVELMASGKTPILEPGIQEIIIDSHAQGRLSATTDVDQAVRETEISFLCVGTPSQPNGKLDLKGIAHVCGQIGASLKTKDTFHVVVTRSTILPGTTAEVIIPALEAASGKKAGRDFGVATNPEFLREGSAIKDFLNPPMTVLGVNDPTSGALLRELYVWAPAELFVVPVPAAEMVKYACNSFHALKVAFANEIGTLCKHAGVDTEAVIRIFLSDKQLNISPYYLNPGFAFGGSCLPKDVRALTYRAKELDCRLPLVESIMPSNHEHIERAAQSILAHGRKKIGLLGLSFKSGTDDLRESPQVLLIKKLLGEGCQARIWDENVYLGRLMGSNRRFIEDNIPHIGSLLTNDLEQVVRESEIVLIGTRVDRAKLELLLQPHHIVIDLINLHQQNRVSHQGMYEGICW